MKSKFKMLPLLAIATALITTASPVSKLGSVFSGFAVTAEAASTYSVDYSYNSKKYSVSSVTGDNSVSLAEIMSALELSGTVSKVESFDDTCVSASYDNEQWTITTHKAFGSGALYVTIDDTKYTLTVTSLPDSISVALYSRIYFDANGGSGTMTTIDKWKDSHTNSALIREGSYYTLPECDYIAPEGYKFSHWEINGLEYSPGQDFYYPYPYQKVIVKAIWEEGIGSTLKNLKDNISYCVDTENSKVYILFKFTPADGKTVNDYDHLAIINKTVEPTSDSYIIKPSSSLGYIDAQTGYINTVYSSVKFSDDSIVNAGNGEYIVGIMIDSTTAEPNTDKFDIISFLKKDIEQGNDVNDD